MGEDVMDEDKKGITYSFDVCNHCKNGCCQDAKPPLSEKRKKIIKDHLKRHRITIRKPFAKAGYSYPSVDGLLFCVFWDRKTAKCAVHPVKPETCMAGPVTFDINFSTKKIEWFLKKSEVCGLAARLFSDEAVFKRHFDIAKKQLVQLICELDPEDIWNIVKVDEPETFKIGEDDLPSEAIDRLGLK